MKLVVLDENFKKIEELNLSKDQNNFQSNKYKNTLNIMEEYKAILDSIPSIIGIYTPTENIDDFHISFLNKNALDFIQCKKDEVKSLSNSLLNISKIKIINKGMKNVLSTGKSENFYFEYYTEDILYKCLNVQILKKDNFVYIIGNDKTSNLIVSENKNQSIEEYSEEIEINKEEKLFLNETLDFIQNITNTCFVYTINDKYYYSSNFYKLLETESNTTNYGNTIKNMIIKEDQGLFDENYKEFKSDKKDKDFIIRINTPKNNLKYIQFFITSYHIQNNQINIAFLKDTTEDQVYSNNLNKTFDKSLRLQWDLNKIQKISKTALSFNEYGKIEWSSSIFDILRLNPKDYEDHPFDFTKYILEEDVHYLYETYDKITPDFPESNTMFRIKNANGEINYIKCYIHSVYDNKGNEIRHVNFYEDITKEIKRTHELENSLKETKKLQIILNKLQSVSETAILYKEEGKYIVSPEFFEVLEVDPNDYKEHDIIVLDNYVIDKNSISTEDYINSLSPENPEIFFVKKIKTAKGNIRYIRIMLHEDYDKERNFISGVGFTQEISKEIENKNKLEHTLNDKNILLKEVHHRVKNNLQILLSLINLNQAYEMDSEHTLLNAQNHLYAMALIHEKIYRSDTLSEIDMKDYIESLVTAILDLYESNIKFHEDIDQINLSMEESIPLGLIINELVTNTIKYAFPGKKDGNIFIELKKVEDHYKFVYIDDGKGLPNDLDINNINSLGLTVITNLTFQIDGNLSFLDCDGTGYAIEFKKG